MKRTWLSFTLTAALCLGLLPGTARASEGGTEEPYASISSTSKNIYANGLSLILTAGVKENEAGELEEDPYKTVIYIDRDGDCQLSD